MEELKIEDLQVGEGAEAKAGQTVTVHYRGTLENGQEFDASYNRGTPFNFLLGAGQVIKGWGLILRWQHKYVGGGMKPGYIVC